MSNGHNLVFNLNEICRLCLSQVGPMSSIFEAEKDVDISWSVPKKIMTCSSVKVSEDDGLPTQICHHCKIQLDSWYSFKVQCQNSDITLRQYVSQLCSPSKKVESYRRQRTTNLKKPENSSVHRRRGRPKKFKIEEIYEVSSEAEYLLEESNTKFNSSEEGNNRLNLSVKKRKSMYSEESNKLESIVERDENLDALEDVQTKVDSLEEDYEVLIVDDNVESDPDVKAESNDIKFETLETDLEDNDLHSGDIKYSESVKSCDSEGDLSIYETDTEMQEEVEQLEKIKPRQKSFKCPECLKSFSSRTYLKDHRAIHSGEKRFECKDCGKAFFSDRKLKLHSKIHSVDKSCLCNICGKLFCEKSDLKKHFQSHSEESPYLCNVCGKTFKTKFYLSRHMMIHSGEKRFVCPICQRCFTWKDTLIAHAKVHTGERPIPCSVCTKTFKRKEDLTRHMRIHTGEKPFVCSYCKRSFSDKWNLTQHLRLHTGDKPYVCSICKQAFTHNVTLRNHVKQHNSNTSLSFTVQPV